MDKKLKDRLSVSWYIHLNIMVMSFLFVLFIIKQTNKNTFKEGLKKIFSVSTPHKRSVRIQIHKTERKNQVK